MSWYLRACYFGCLGLVEEVWELVGSDGAAGFLLGRVVGFVGQHPLLGATAAAAFLAANSLGAGALGRNVAGAQGFDLVE